MPQIIEVPNYGQVEFPDGMSDADIVSAIKKTSMGYKSANGFGSKLNDAIGQIPRQLGLTARYALEGGIGALFSALARLSGTRRKRWRAGGILFWRGAREGRPASPHLPDVWHRFGRRPHH